MQEEGHSLAIDVTRRGDTHRDGDERAEEQPGEGAEMTEKAEQKGQK